MGYIPPVQPNQYQEYQNRIRAVKSSYSRTVRVDKLKRAYLFQLEVPINKKVSPKSKHTKQPERDAEKVYAFLTGIGGNVNERI
ncbi:hypothetical protein [Bacillus sp. EB600]|uniref:hypothetical protein n=1 Tax=Bacillus sp. EB600 TaxID=2806345 RepID=UPI00210C9CD8|nr:hypothetical protein [Bacillus sp. EB600]MCQ6280940.1 hypothetical protein [Bacillus sp. EB600]